MNHQSHSAFKSPSPYLSALGAWALAFGCSVGWGAFVMPGTTFLPIAGPLGTAIGIALGALVMLVIARNYHYLINRFPGGGGAYTYTKRCFGYDHGFLSAWFLLLTYVAIIWANGTALPLIFRTLFGGAFQFGFHYEIAGFHIYLGEILVVVGSFLIGALVCMRRSLAARAQIVMAILLLAGAITCFVGAFHNGTAAVAPDFSPDHDAFGGTFIIFALAPWAFVGFESISHSSGEAKFRLKRSFLIMALALAAAAIAYICLAVLSVTALPEECASWVDYLANLDRYAGVKNQPAFFAAQSALGNMGRAVLGVAAVCAIFTGIIGNYVALSRLLRSMSMDRLLPERIGKLDKNNVPKTALWLIFGMSSILPFFGRTAISWIVDVTTVGATIAFAFTSASTLRVARRAGDKRYVVTGVVGLILSLLFALEFLIPNITSVKTLATESYLILAAWGILGFLVFWYLLKKDDQHRLGRSTVAWIVLLGLIIFTSSVWMRQSTTAAVENSVAPIQSYYSEKLAEAGVDVVSGATRPAYAYLYDVLNGIDRSLAAATVIQVALIVLSLVILFRIYSKIQKRERETEIEKALAEENSRAKTSFLSNMSHEIRTPMNAIIGLDNIALRDPDLPPKTRDQLEKIGASAKHLLGLINDILDMSRIESGRMVLKNEEFSFREFIEQVHVIINGQCADKGLTFVCDVSPDIRDYYVGDDMKLKQVLINILGNAVKFTEAPGTVTLRARPLAMDEDGCLLRFDMIDTGIGMDKEFLPKLFEAFSQEDATTTNQYGGSGLGMAITKNFVDMMNGQITVDSEKGVGTTFTVMVRLGRSDRVFTVAAPIAERENALEGRRILTAEDVETNAEILADLLELEGMSAERAQNGQQAVDMFAEKPAGYYDAILMDMRMPVMDGLSATKAIRALDRPDAKTIPIIAMTANVFDEDIRQTMAAGMNAHLFKPIEPDKLYAMLADMIANGSPKAPQ
ncbi:MAG: amino acid permease [Oscillospiraceae bacterium]|jgi:signal transduction histidine kinase/CheY-like chemotaxis protein